MSTGTSVTVVVSAGYKRAAMDAAIVERLVDMGFMQVTRLLSISSAAPAAGLPDMTPCWAKVTTPTQSCRRATSTTEQRRLLRMALHPHRRLWPPAHEGRMRSPAESRVCSLLRMQI